MKYKGKRSQNLLELTISSGRAMIYNSGFSRLADDLALKFKKGSILSYPEISGTMDGMSVEIKVAGEEFGNVFQIEVRDFFTAGSTFCFRRKKHGIIKSLFVEEEGLKLGEPSFDQKIIIVEGDYTLALSLLNHKLREEMLKLTDLCLLFNINRECLMVELEAPWVMDQYYIRSVVQKALAIAKNLGKNKTIAESLRDNFQSEPLAKIRLAILKSAIEQFHGSDPVKKILHSALEDPDQDIQLEAAVGLGSEGLNHLGKIVQNIEGDNDVNISRLNLAIDHLFKNPGAPQLKALQNLYTRIKDKTIQLKILSGFKKLKDKSLSHFLVEILETSPSSIKRDVVTALATCGNIQAVEKLCVLEKKTLNPKFRKEIRETINQIQSRLGDAEKGWLSTVEVKGKDGKIVH